MVDFLVIRVLPELLLLVVCAILVAVVGGVFDDCPKGQALLLDREIEIKRTSQSEITLIASSDVRAKTCVLSETKGPFSRYFIEGLGFVDQETAARMMSAIRFFSHKDLLTEEQIAIAKRLAGQ